MSSRVPTPTKISKEVPSDLESTGTIWRPPLTCDLLNVESDTAEFKIPTTKLRRYDATSQLSVYSEEGTTSVAKQSLANGQDLAQSSMDTRSATMTCAIDINSKLESPKTMEETVGMDYTPAKAKSENPDESLDCDYGEKPKSPSSDLPTSPKTEKRMEWDSSEQPEQPSSSELIVQKKPISPENFDDLVVMSGKNSSSPKQLADSSMDKPKSRGSSKSPGHNSASPLEAPRSHESLKNSEATPARKSPTPESSNKIDDNSVSTAVRSSVSPAKDLEDKTVKKSVETNPVIPVEEDPIPDSPQSPDASADSDNEEIRKTDTSSKPRAMSDDDEAGTSSEGSGSMSRHATPDTKPWQSPRQQPVDGVVQPRTNPPPGKPTRHTNCLDYVLFTVIEGALRHKNSWPFQKAVNAKKLGIPEYHSMISRPMDFHTIEQRIRNIYYWSAQDAIQDINQLFINCYMFNHPMSDVSLMAKTLERQIQRQLKDLPRSEKEQEFPDIERKMTFMKWGRMRSERKRQRTQSGFEDNGLNIENDEDNQSAKKQSEIRETKPSTTQPPAKKRKAQIGGDGVAVAKAAFFPATPAPVPNDPNSMVDWKNLSPRWQGKKPEWQKKLFPEVGKIVPDSYINQSLIVNTDPVEVKAETEMSPALSVHSSNQIISGPRPSNASIASTPAGNARGRQPKSDRPRKSLYSPAPGWPVASVPVPVQQRTRLGGKIPHISMYGRTSGDKSELWDKIKNVPELYLHPILRMIQLAQLDASKDVYTLLSLCDEEVDFNDAEDDLVIEILDYLEMSKRDKARASRVRDEIEVRAKFYGFDAFDSKRGIIPKNKINQAPFQNRLRSDSPSPSVTRRSSDSDSEPLATQGNPAMHKRHRPNNISATSSRGSTPAAAAPSSRPH